jgi:hypothetical protein
VLGRSMLGCGLGSRRVCREGLRGGGLVAWRRWERRSIWSCTVGNKGLNFLEYEIDGVTHSPDMVYMY